MKRYLIRIYSGWYTYCPMLREEIKEFRNEKEAEAYAREIVKGTNYGYSANKIWEPENE